LVLTLDDAIVLAVENNLDIELARYELPRPRQTLCARKRAARREGWQERINLRLPSAAV
jgi:hypothetical protein